MNEMATVMVSSTEHWIDTGIALEAGKAYELVADGEWHDASIATGPDGYESVNALQKVTERLRRVPDARWFALIGALDRRRGTEFVIGSKLLYRPTESGKLTCFANDLVGFYENNRGSVTLRVTEMSF